MAEDGPRSEELVPVLGGELSGTSLEKAEEEEMMTGGDF